jgi:cytochrome c-type biogenesis protein CcmH
LLAALVAALALAGPAAAATCPQASLTKLEGELMCLVCKTTLDQSDSPFATRMKELLAAQVNACKSEAEIKSYFVAQFGDSILAAPPGSGFNVLAWVLPFVGIGGGAVVLFVLARRWSSRRELVPATAEAPLDADAARRLDEELARFDA